MHLTADYHTHTPYSHGKNTVGENVARAKELGLEQIAIADHGFAHIAYGIRRKQFDLYKAECAAAEKEFGVKVLVGMEANIRSVFGETDMQKSDYEDFDVFLCGNHIFIRYATLGDWWKYGLGNIYARKIIHHHSDKLIARNTTAYIQTIKNNPLDILTHLNYLCPANALEVAKCAADYGTYIELNAKKLHLTDEELCEIVAKTSARFVIGSDAHSAVRVGECSLVEQQLERISFPMDRIDNIEGRLPKFRFAQYKKGNYKPWRYR